MVKRDRGDERDKQHKGETAININGKSQIFHWENKVTVYELCLHGGKVCADDIINKYS